MMCYHGEGAAPVYDPMCRPSASVSASHKYAPYVQQGNFLCCVIRMFCARYILQAYVNLTFVLRL